MQWAWKGNNQMRLILQEKKKRQLIYLGKNILKTSHSKADTKLQLHFSFQPRIYFGSCEKLH